MLAQITLLTSLAFSFLYPLCFWLSFKEPLKNQFHHFHTATPNIVGGMVTIFILKGVYPTDIKILAGFWFLFSFILTCIYWRKETIQVCWLTLASIVGGVLYYFILNADITALIVSLLANAIFCLSLYAMNLGHWYLNVHGLPIQHLKNASYALWIAVVVRLMWDIFYIVTGRVIYDGEHIKVFEFMMQMDGIFILVGLAFGIFLPIVALFMVKEILKLKNTQATTGILYVILCGIILADLTFKFYFLKYGVTL